MFNFQEQASEQLTVGNMMWTTADNLQKINHTYIENLKEVGTIVFAYAVLTGLTSTAFVYNLTYKSKSSYH